MDEFSNRDFRKLLYKYFENTCTKEDLVVLAKWTQSHPVLLEKFLAEYWDSLAEQPDIENEKLLVEILLSAKKVEAADPENTGIKGTKYEPIHSINRGRKKWLQIAAAVIFMIASSTIIWYWVLNQNTSTEAIAHELAQSENDRLPGGNKAVLTLADGSRIILDSAGNGEISRQGDIAVLKLNDGELSYKGEGTGDKEIAYNTITTPRGGQYQIVLADGTRVWLNAESSLRFPITFTSSERKVELTGEGYFEVAHQADHPFYVEARGMEVKVLGTHFNVKAYNDEADIQTTLLEGKVEVKAGKEEMLLSPGQQAKLYSEGEKLEKLQGIDITKVMAWKNGEFIFDETELEDALKMLSRWYDVQVVYSGKLEPTYVYGSIPRSKNLSEVLKILEVGGIRFRLEQQDGNNKLIVLK